MNFLQRTPFFRLIIPLIAGIVVSQYVKLSVLWLLMLLILSALFIVTSLLFKKPGVQFKYRWFFGTGIFLFLFSLGCILTETKDKSSEFPFLNQKEIYRVELTEAPVEKAKSYKCEVELLSVFREGSWQPAHGKALVYFQKDSFSASLLFGDRIMLRTEFKTPIGAVNPDGFNYAAYLKRQGIMATAYIPSGTWQLSDINTSFSVRRLADESRRQLLKIFRKFEIAGDEFAVLAALTLGFTDALQPDIMTSYSATGAMHILSVSGLHVGIVYVVIAFVLSFFGKSKRSQVLKAVFILLFLWMYAFLTGLSPSVVRSTLMFSLVAIGSALDRKSQIYNTVFMSAFVMLLINPDFLFDVGFQLSYAAVLSIVFFQKPFASLVPVKSKWLRWFRDLISVSIAAQLGTIPVTLYYFHQFPNYFLLTNIVAIPLSTLIIYMAIVLLVVSFVPYLSAGIAFLLKWCVWLMNFLIAGIEHLPHSVSEISFNFSQMWLSFMALALIVTYFYTKKFTVLFAGLSAVLFVLVISLQTRWETLHAERVIVFSSQKSLQMNFIDHGNNFALSGDSAEMQKIAGSYWKSHQLQKPIFIASNGWCKNNCLEFYGKKFLIPDEKWWKRISYEGVLEVDYLIISNKSKPKVKNLFRNILPQNVIVDNTVSDWYTQSVRQYCVENQIPFYSVAEQGACVLNIQR